MGKHFFQQKKKTQVDRRNPSVWPLLSASLFLERLLPLRNWCLDSLSSSFCFCVEAKKEKEDKNATILKRRGRPCAPPPPFFENLLFATTFSWNGFWLHSTRIPLQRSFLSYSAEYISLPAAKKVTRNLKNPMRKITRELTENVPILGPV